jgi:peptidoglycan/xylan/chitin deacetylase (PgdA/CDA1 family)
MQTRKEPVTLISRLCFAAALAASPALAQETPDCTGKLGTSRTVTVNGDEKLELGLQSYPRTLALDDHEVVLTFDDGPAATTSAALDALKKECVRATFFLIGKSAAASPELVKREVADGHSLGYHSNSHPARTLREMPMFVAKSDIETGIANVDKAAFGAAQERPHFPFFRFPGYADSPELLDYVHSRGLAVLGSDLWASDWRSMSPQEELKLVMERLEKERKGIVLFHDSKASTVKMLPDFLRALKERGFKVVHMVGGSEPTRTVEAGPGWTSTTEPIVRKVLGEKRKAQEQHRHDD